MTEGAGEGEKEGEDGDDDDAVVVVEREISKKEPKKRLADGARWSVRSMSVR